MNTVKRMIIVFAVLIICAANACAQGSPQGKRGHQGPPPEAYEACEGKSAGDTAQFVSPHGDTVCGTCVQEEDRLILRPDDPPERRRRNNADD